MAAIVNYSTLQDAVTQYLIHSDDAGLFDTFLKLAENRFNKELRVRELVSDTVGTTGAGFVSSNTTLSADFVEPIAIYLSAPVGNSGSLSYLPPNKFFNLKSSHSGTGIPKYYTIFGNKMHFSPFGTSCTANWHYYKELTPLTSSNATNELMPSAANLYLYGVLLEAQPFLNQPERITEFESFYDRAKDSLIAADARARLRPGVGQRMRASGVTADGVFRIP